ncbi:hypothetical protein LCGC14_0987290 [marine sediment metagenome]|uniref:Uncharacterized protein n=1 Tax=marine sediment metagenome TaxID=412755 RepID=A0A0F9RDI2_9ZZZZ
MESGEMVGRVFYALCLLSDAHEELEREQRESAIEYINDAKAHLVAVVDSATPGLKGEMVEWIRTLDLELEPGREALSLARQLMLLEVAPPSSTGTT